MNTNAVTITRVNDPDLFPDLKTGDRYTVLPPIPDLARTTSRDFQVVDDDGEVYFTISVPFSETGEEVEDTLTGLLAYIGADVGATELRDISGHDDDWSAS